MIYFTMSESGSCSRVLSAEKLGNEPAARPPADIDRLRYYTMLERVAADQLANENIGDVLEGGLCETCGNGRMGIHVEIDEGLYKLVGHMDRLLIVKGVMYPVEIKCLGPASWKQFKTGQFKEFMSYAYQECCYLEARKKPGIYWVMNRDSGECLKYTINDTENVLDFPNFEKLTLPITYAQIVDKLNGVYIDVQSKSLSEPQPNDNCYWCLFKYLCKGVKSAATVDDKEIANSADLYKEGLAQETEGKRKKDTAVNKLVTYAKLNKTDKFRSNGVSFTYHGEKTNQTIDKDKLKALVSSDVMSQIMKEGKPFDSYTIKVLGE